MTKDILEFENNLETKAVPVKKEKKPKIKRPKKTTTEGNYINNSVLLPEMIRAKELGRVTDELAVMYMKIAERYSMSKNFVTIPFREDMVSAGVLNLLKNGLKFNPERSNNPFSYLTQCLYHSFLQVIADEKDQRDIRDTLLLDEGMNASLGFMEKEHDNYRENHADFFGVD
jgi:hypothetical protein